ncbi:hypothetical protein [Clostridium sp.]|uniref:hypothetical protein n=1 Tax=Clostridium sp. TaxID=1506 RepID=UPI003217CAC3
MIFFKNKTIETTIKTKVKNKIGQLVDEGYKKDGNSYRVNIQPMDIKSIKYVFGEDIIADFQMYHDGILNVKDIIVMDNKIYSIEKVILWNTYNLYAIKSVDVEVLS